MVSAGYDIGYFQYTELSNNYDAIYETLVDGGVVWMHLNYNDCGVCPTCAGKDNYCRFMVTDWRMTYDGLTINCPDGSVLVFPNGSYTPVTAPK